MLRQIASRRSVSTWLPRRIVAAASSGEQVTVHRVRMRTRRDWARKVAIYSITGVFCYYTWVYVATLPLKNLDLKSIPETEEDEEDEPFFIPFPFTETQVQPLPYAGAEEEWQEFLKFNKDQAHRQKVKDDLSMLVKKAAEHNPVTKNWGKNGKEFQLGPTWLIISFPERPPPEFIRAGIEISDEAISITTQKVDAKTKAMIDRILKPYPMASASYAFVKTFFKQSTSDVAKFFGYSSEGTEISTSSPDPEIAKTLKRLEARQTATGGAAAGSSAAASTASRTDPGASSSEKSDSQQSETQKSRGAGQPSDEDDRMAPIKKAIPNYSDLVEKGRGPWAAFISQYKRLWRPLKYYPPRGCLAVHGMVALDSPKGHVFIDVFAWYHPKTKEFHQDSFHMSLKAISPSNQKPRR
ncbi:hypothetical protein VM1G_06550 [Cytospora mali]|uniref:Uncharacterized protein n=1 Tax=Cytospora mali TaxID=578113 RepID=A0A194W1C8_CYTMA|nr:hypothetical protein VM1G_06550 [Valsa mali]